MAGTAPSLLGGDAGRSVDPREIVTSCSKQEWTIEVTVRSLDAKGDYPHGFIKVRLAGENIQTRADKKKMRGAEALYTFTGRGPARYEATTQLPTDWYLLAAKSVSAGPGQPRVQKIVLEVNKMAWVGILVIDEDGRPAPGLSYSFSVPAGSDPAAGTLGSDASARHQVRRGACKVKFLDVPAGALARDAAATGPAPGAKPLQIQPALLKQKQVTAQQGDSLLSIAWARLRPDWRPVWNANVPLQQARRDPQMLMPGDVVSIPPAVPDEFMCDLEQVNVFRLKRPCAMVDIVLRNGYGYSLAEVPYEVRIGSYTSAGTTDRTGRLCEVVPPSAAEATLAVWPQDNARRRLWKLEIGKLLPVLAPDGTAVPDLRGVQARLASLGFYSGPIDGDPNKTRPAVADLQDFAANPKPDGITTVTVTALLEALHNSLGVSR
jgi:hypothetical protein